MTQGVVERDTIERKVRAGARLDAEQAAALLAWPDVIELGRWADETARQRGQTVYYSINRHINYTNICTIGCEFCGFSCTPDNDRGYALSVPEVAEQARQATESGATEVHIVGGINPALPGTYYLEMVKAVRTACSRVHIKAFTAPEIIDIAAKLDEDIPITLRQLQQAGLDALPGGGAEILSDTYFERVCPNKPSPAAWLAVHQQAHALGLVSNATMLYGFGESIQQRTEHLLQLRALQDHSLKATKGCFQCFVPLPYVPSDTGAAQRLDALGDLRIIAASRLILDNIPHIKAFWPMLTIKLAQVALLFGADDLDGTVSEYRVVADTDGAPQQGMPADRLERLIQETGKTPCHRDGFYRPYD